MQAVTFVASCPFEIGDKIRAGKRAHIITDIVCMHHVKSGEIKFLYELDDSRKLVFLASAKEGKDAE